MAASVDTDLESADSPIASRTQRASGGLNKLFRLDLATSTKRKIREGQEIQERTLKTLEEGKSVIPGDQHQDLHSQFRDLEKRGETLESYSGFQAFRHRGVVSKWLKAVEKLYSKTLTKSKQARSDKLLEEQMDLLEHELEEMELGPPSEHAEFRLHESLSNEQRQDLLRSYIEDLTQDEEHYNNISKMDDRENAKHLVGYIDSIMGLVAQDTQYRHLRRRSIHLLKKLCETHGIYPSSFIVPRREIRKTPGTLTHGGSADVWEGRYKESSVALKEFRASTKGRVDPDFLKSFCREVAIWKYLDHPNITKCYGVSSQKSPLCLVSKWMVNGTLDAYLKVKRGINRLELIRDIVAGLCYLHEMGLVHGDLKCLNILVDENGIACLADFGLALFAHNEHTNFIAKTTIKGSTTRWAAPEILHTDASSIHPTMESDVYSFAWVMWEVFTGHIPFFEIQSAAGVITRVLDKKRPQRPLQATGIGLSDEVWDIMEQCWRHEPDARPPMTSVQECLEHILKEQDPAVLKMPTVWPLVIEPSSTPDPKSPS